MRVQSTVIAAKSQSVYRFCCFNYYFLSRCILIRSLYYDIISLNGTLTQTNKGVGRVALQVLGSRGVTIFSL